jgi:hypothetical protein
MGDEGLRSSLGESLPFPGTLAAISTCWLPHCEQTNRSR